MTATNTTDYAALLRHMADNLEKGLPPRHDIEMKDKGVWRNVPYINVINLDRSYTEYRIKPATVVINGIEVPEPLKEEPGNSYYIYMVIPSVSHGVMKTFWGNSLADRILLKRGFLHLSEENAIAHAKALGWCEE